MPTDSWGSNSKVHISNVVLGNQTKCHLWFLFKMGVNSKKGWICWHALENQETTSAGFNYARFFPLLMGWRFSSVTNSTSFCLWVMCYHFGGEEESSIAEVVHYYLVMRRWSYCCCQCSEWNWYYVGVSHLLMSKHF